MEEAHQQMETFLVGSFWKDQLNGAATRLPSETIEADSLFDAINLYISKHYPFLGNDDYELVRKNIREF